MFLSALMVDLDRSPTINECGDLCGTDACAFSPCLCTSKKGPRMSKTQAFVRLDDGKVTIEEDWFLPFEDLIERNTPMKYILMMSATKDVFDWYSNWPKEDLHANAAFMQSFNKELKDEGVLVAT